MAQFAQVRMSFPGGRQVAAEIGAHRILSDQPREAGGNDEAPSPFSYFLASIGACAGFYALAFCQKRGIPTEGLEVLAQPSGEGGTLDRIEIEVKLPEAFPERYRAALLRAIDGCSVKRAIEAQPSFTVAIV